MYVLEHDDQHVPLPDDLMMPLATEPEPKMKVKAKREKMYRMVGLLCIILVVVFFITIVSWGEGNKKKEEVRYTRRHTAEDVRSTAAWCVRHADA